METGELVLFQCYYCKKEHEIVLNSIKEFSCEKCGGTIFVKKINEEIDQKINP